MGKRHLTETADLQAPCCSTQVQHLLTVYLWPAFREHSPMCYVTTFLLTSSELLVRTKLLWTVGNLNYREKLLKVSS
jgi:hypothetical protein